MRTCPIFLEKVGKHMNIQWYPGHMTKARRQMQEDIKLIDVVVELVDARVPMSSKNPDIDTVAAGKSRLILLNKCDLASEKHTKAWENWFKSKGYYVVKLDSRSKAGVKGVTAAVTEACQEKIERNRRRGIINRPLRAMVVGIPNVGKSTFINSYAGRACAKTGNKPGVTKGKQWIRLNKNLELLDTPGILWPKFEDQQVGIRLALIGSIKDDILDIGELCVQLINLLKEHYPGKLNERYGVDETKDAVALISDIAEARKCLLKGNELDLAKAEKLLLDDFRSCRLGKITLEFPENEEAGEDE